MKIKRSKKVMENYVCPKCWNQVQNCTCETYPPWRLVNIDVNIQEVIRILNTKGYTTVYCCESHFGYSFSIYISFPWHFDFDAPEGFEYKKTWDRVAYSYSKKERENKELFEQVKAEKLRALLAWAQALPKYENPFRKRGG